MTAKGDARTIFAEAFERHRHAIHAFLLGRTSDPEAARDLVQETFLRLWRTPHVYELDDDAQRAWLHTVARNLVVDRYRAEATRRAALTAVRTAAQEEAEPDAADRVVARDDLARLDEAVAALDEEHRVVLSMSVVAGMSSREIGEALGLPPGTVRARLHEARKRLRRTLEE
jgi:RNA polymerase sigma-70 factor (ECF subfamily)